MSDKMRERIKAAVIEWARDRFGNNDMVVHLFDDEDDDPERYVAVLAVRGLNEWQAAEVWLEEDRVVSINALGEGVPPDGVSWPWQD
jgi:hypothetical protein